MQSRRSFLKNSGIILASSALPVYLPLKQKKSLGIALVGLGYYSSDLLAPALQMTEHCHLAGIVSGSANKVPTWQKKYGIKDSNVYTYDDLHQIANNDDIDVIYIVLPTGLHAEYAVRAANTGKHVWCEKPMARTEAECKEIIDACHKNKVKLSIGYRMQHEPNTRKIMEYAKTKPFGAIEKVIAEAGYFDGRTDHWKQKKAMGGGAMYDMGVYSLNACRYAAGEEPISVTARHSTNRPEIYTEVDETTHFTLKFPSGVIANGKTSFGENLNRLHVTCDKGWYELSPMQSYSGVRGKDSSGNIFRPFQGNQQAQQMDDDARAIIQNEDVMVPGEEGMRDIRIVEAIYRAAALGKEVKL